MAILPMYFCNVPITVCSRKNNSSLATILLYVKMYDVVVMEIILSMGLTVCQFLFAILYIVTDILLISVTCHIVIIKLLSTGYLGCLLDVYVL